MAGDLEARRSYGAELVEGSVMEGGREEGGRKDSGKEGLGFTPSKTGTITWSVSPQGSPTVGGQAFTWLLRCTGD